MRALTGAALLLTSSSVLARDKFDRDYGVNDNSHYHHADRHRGGWIGDNRGHHGAPRGGHLNDGHGHFSPRGQGGYHWGW